MAIPDVSVIVVNYNTKHLLGAMLASLSVALAGVPNEIIVVDNASSDPGEDEVRRLFQGSTIIFNQKNVGFGRANNQAYAVSKGRFVLLLNTDAFVSPNVVRLAIKHLEENPDCGVVGAQLEGRDGSAQASARNFPSPLNIFASRVGLRRLFPWIHPMDSEPLRLESTVACDWVPGCFLLIRREAIRNSELFDPRYFLYYEETDLCWRVKQNGWTVSCLAGSTVTHIGGESAATAGTLTPKGRQLVDLQIESEILFIRKHYGLTGLLSHLVLVAVASAYEIVKSLLRISSLDVFSRCSDELSRYLSLLRATRCGRHPTR